MAQELKTLQAAVERAARVEAKRKPVLGSWTKLIDYCRVTLQHETHEQFRVLFLDVKNQILADEVLGEGTIDHAPVYPREVVRRALELRAASMILVHNHPSQRASRFRTKGVSGCGNYRAQLPLLHPIKEVPRCPV
ncbi:MAG: DNA repair protein RadC [Alphaproteobacteria bacterium]|nr:MAG: DNA repair protein RadC [Alphaproteobacteria bacterium]